MHEISEVPEWNVLLNLLLDPSVSEVQSNGPTEFFIKRNGERIQVDNLYVNSVDDYADGIKRGLVPHVVTQLPYNDKTGYLFEGPLRYTAAGTQIRARCTIVLPPAAEVPQVNLAKKSTTLLSIDDIAAKGSMSTEMLNFIKATVQAELTVVFSGSTGAGKTTMLEAMTRLIPNSSRIGIAEDTPELLLEQPNTVYLHSVPFIPGMDPNDEADLAWVVRQFQRLRIDKIIVGETRGKEFADFLVAANSGMTGSLTTIHADDPRSCLGKMSRFAMSGSDRQPMRSINTDIASAIDIIVQLGILPDGRHKVMAIEEITTTVSNGEDAMISTARLYEYNPQNDTFVKKMHPTDEMRRRLSNKGVNLQNFLSVAPNTVMPPHKVQVEAPVQNRSPFGRGLPTNLGDGRRSL